MCASCCKAMLKPQETMVFSIFVSTLVVVRPTLQIPASRSLLGMCVWKPSVNPAAKKKSNWRWIVCRKFFSDFTLFECVKLGSWVFNALDYHQTPRRRHLPDIHCFIFSLSKSKTKVELLLGISFRIWFTWDTTPCNNCIHIPFTLSKMQVINIGWLLLFLLLHFCTMWTVCLLVYRSGCCKTTLCLAIWAAHGANSCLGPKKLHPK